MYGYMKLGCVEGIAGFGGAGVFLAGVNDELRYNTKAERELKELKTQSKLLKPSGAQNNHLQGIKRLKPIDRCTSKESILIQ